MTRKILIMGLSGAGKTTLAKALVPLLNAVYFNADEVRQHINSDLGFSLQDRITHAMRLGWLCDRVVEAGVFAVADFICPTVQTRAAFGSAFTVWVDRGVTRSAYADTDALFEPPEHVDVHVTSMGTPRFWAERIAALVRPHFGAEKAFLEKLS